MNFQPDLKYENCIWQLWLQGTENSPEIVKKCLESVEKYAGGRQVIVLTEANIENYVNIPDFIREKYEKGIISRTHFSDYIRILLLGKYGGTWIDATCLLTSEIPQEIIDSEFFVFQNTAWMSMPKKSFDFNFFNLIQKYYGSAYHLGSSWFINAKANNIIVLTIIKLLENYWQKNDKLVDYYLFHYLMTIAVLISEKNKDCFDKMPSYSNVTPHLLQYNLRDSFNEKIFKKMIEVSFIHKLTYKRIDVDPKVNNYLNYILNNL